MMNLLKVNVGMCEVCDNYTPRVYVEEFAQECCEYCFEAYGECNQYEIQRIRLLSKAIRHDGQSC